MIIHTRASIGHPVSSPQGLVGRRYGLGVAIAITLTLLPACGEVEHAATGTDATESQNATETTNGALVQNVAYRSGTTTLQTHGATDVGAAVFNNVAYLAYVRTDSRIGFITEPNLDNGSQSSTGFVLSDTCAYGPAIIPFNGFLYLFYVGMNRGFYMRRFDGTNWQGPWVIAGGNAEYRPAPFVLNGVLSVVVAYAIPNTDGNVLAKFDINPDGVSASADYNFAWEYTSHTPAAAVWNGIVYLSWAGTDSNNPVYIKHFDPAVGSWSPPIIVPGNWGQPSLFPLPTQLEMVYRGNNAHFYRIYTNDGLNFSSPAGDLASTSDHPPAPFYASGSSDVWVFYPGQNGQLYTALE